MKVGQTFSKLSRDGTMVDFMLMSKTGYMVSYYHEGDKYERGMCRLTFDMMVDSGEIQSPSDKKCMEYVSDGFTVWSCGNKAKFEVSGKLYCGIHNPNKKRTNAQIISDQNRCVMYAKAAYKVNCKKLVETLILEGDMRAVELKRLLDEQIIKASAISE